MALKMNDYGKKPNIWEVGVKRKQSVNKNILVKSDLEQYTKQE